MARKQLSNGHADPLGAARQVPAAEQRLLGVDNLWLMVRHHMQLFGWSGPCADALRAQRRS